jgi:TRAP-type C4-dicarboxylate transport system permease small subunit
VPDDLSVAVSTGRAPRIARIVESTARTLLGLLLICMVLVNVVNAVCRYLFSAVIVGADEVLVYAMVWMVMTGMILVTIDQRHIALEFLVNRLRSRARVALVMVHNVIIAVGGTYMAVQCLEFTKGVRAIGQTSMALGLPMVFAHSALVVGFAGVALVAALLVISAGAELISSRSSAETKLP